MIERAGETADPPFPVRPHAPAFDRIRPGGQRHPLLRSNGCGAQKGSWRMPKVRSGHIIVEKEIGCGPARLWPEPPA